jgi:acyl carrier protein
MRARRQSKQSQSEGQMADVAADVMAIIAKKVRVDNPDLQQSDRLEELGIESIDAVEMIFDLEEKFDIQIPYNANNARTEFDTVGDVVRAIENLVREKS